MLKGDPGALHRTQEVTHGSHVLHRRNDEASRTGSAGASGARDGAYDRYAATDAAAQTDQPTDPAAVVHAFNAALSRGDLDAALALLDPTCRKVVGPHSLNREEQTCGGGEGQFPGPQSGPPIQIAEANLRTTGPETAEVDMTLSGNTLPPTPHPITLHAYFTVKNGRITATARRAFVANRAGAGSTRATAGTARGDAEHRQPGTRHRLGDAGAGRELRAGGCRRAAKHSRTRARTLAILSVQTDAVT